MRSQASGSHADGPAHRSGLAWITPLPGDIKDEVFDQLPPACLPCTSHGRAGVDMAGQSGEVPFTADLQQRWLDDREGEFDVAAALIDELAFRRPLTGSLRRLRHPVMAEASGEMVPRRDWSGCMSAATSRIQGPWP